MEILQVVLKTVLVLFNNEKRYEWYQNQGQRAKKAIDIILSESLKDGPYEPKYTQHEK